jgi:branched-chain amino acid transport system permease protein
MAVRDSDIAAEMMGISGAERSCWPLPSRHSSAAWPAACWATTCSSSTRTTSTCTVSVAYIAMIIVGGMGSVLGSVLGAAFMTFLPEVLRVGVHRLSQVVPALDVQSKGAFVEGAVYGLVIVFFLMFKPLGLAQFWRDLVAYFRTWPFGH